MQTTRMLHSSHPCCGRLSAASIEEFKNKVIATRETILGRGKIGHENSIPFNNVKPIEKYINLDKISSEK